MSTKFTKILIYVVLALTIVVTTVCAAVLISGGAGVTVSIDTHYISKTAADNNVVIKINGQETNELRVKEGSTVTLTFETVGYDFEGWFAGNEGEWSTASEEVGTEVSYTFNAEGDTKLTAVFNATKYDVSFAGVEGVQNSSYTYGQLLPVPAMEGTQAFIGWADPADSDKIITTMPAIGESSLTLTAKTVDYTSYNFLLDVPASIYVTAGQIQYTYNTGVNISESLNPSRDYYSISAVVINGETIELTDADLNNKIMNELLELNVINYENYQDTTIKVLANVNWTCDVEEVVIALKPPQDDIPATFTIKPSNLDFIEEIVISDVYKDEIEKDRFKIALITYGTATYSDKNLSWADATVKDLFDVLASYKNDISGNLAITIDLDEVVAEEAA